MTETSTEKGQRPTDKDQSPESGICRLSFVVSRLTVVAGFVISRVVFYLLGIRFDAGTLTRHWQYLDPALLKDHLLQSLWYLHSQPPLFNLFLGLVLKVFPNSPTPAFAACYLLLGLLLVIALFSLMVRLGVRPWLASLLTVLFVVSPACILYENWLHYTYPLMTLLVLAALFLHRFLAGGKTRDAACFCGLLAAICLTMSFFHIIWMAIIVIALLALVLHEPTSGKTREQGLKSPGHWNHRALDLVVALALLPVLLWYGKNLVLFRSFSSRTWFGMNFARMTTNFVPPDDLQQLAAEGKVSGVSLVAPFAQLDAYPSYPGEVTTTGIPVLDQPKKADGTPNFNRLDYIGISRQYMNDDLRLLRLRPQAYLRSLLDAWLLYFMPATANRELRDNLERIAPLTRFYEIIQGRIMDYVEPELQRTDMARFYRQKVLNMGFLLLIGYIIALVYGLRQVSPGAGPGQAQSAMRYSPSAITLLFLVFNLVYVLLVGTFGEVGENPRFRFMIDPFILAIVGLFVNQILTRPRPKGRPVEGEEE